LLERLDDPSLVALRLVPLLLELLRLEGTREVPCPELLVSDLWWLLDRDLSLDAPLPDEVFLPGFFGDAGVIGKAGNAQSMFADNSGLGGLGSKILGPGLVALRGFRGGLLPPLLADRVLEDGEIGVGGVLVKNGRLAASELIRESGGCGALMMGGW